MCVKADGSVAEVSTWNSTGVSDYLAEFERGCGGTKDRLWLPQRTRPLKALLRISGEGSVSGHRALSLSLHEMTPPFPSRLSQRRELDNRVALYFFSREAQGRVGTGVRQGLLNGKHRDSTFVLCNWTRGMPMDV